jgi:hypothetical protein
MKTKKILAPTEINGEYFYTLLQFSLITKKSVSTIRRLVNCTNERKRKIKSKKLFGKVFIYASELTEYVWRFSGKGNLKYTFDKEGNKIFKGSVDDL